MSLIPPGPWDEYPALWDTLMIDDVEMPGIATVDVRRGNKWDTKKAKGKNNGEREFTGADDAAIRITLVFWTAEQWTGIKEQLLPLVEPDPTKAQFEARSINHAITAARKVSHITIDNVIGPTAPDQGTSTMIIEATEHRKPSTKGATGTATGTGGNGGRGSIKDQCGSLAQEMYELQQQMAAAQNELASAYAQQADPNFWGNYLEGTGRVWRAEQQIAQLDGLIQDVQQQQQVLGCGSATATGAGAP